MGLDNGIKIKHLTPDERDEYGFYPTNDKDDENVLYWRNCPSLRQRILKSFGMAVDEHSQELSEEDLYRIKDHILALIECYLVGEFTPDNDTECYWIAQDANYDVDTLDNLMKFHNDKSRRKIIFYDFE